MKKTPVQNKAYQYYILTIIFFFLMQNAQNMFQLFPDPKIISPLGIGRAESHEPQPTQTPERILIDNYIREVFGSHADKAFLLLTCENFAHNPNAMNKNRDKEGNVTSIDYGVFQINEYWQKVQPKFLLNWKINIQIAYQLYTENGNQFNLWSCGQKLGI